MIGLLFAGLTGSDIVLASFTAAAGCITVGIAYWISRKSSSRWIARKLVHVTMGTIIGLTLVLYSNLSGPVLAALLFASALLCSWAYRRDSVSHLLAAGTRESGSGFGTFFAGFAGLLSFTVVFFVFYLRPEVFVAAILAVSWGDASGEVFGRTMGGTIFRTRFRGKSVEGSMAVFVFSAISLIVAMTLYSVDTQPFLVLPQILLIAFVVSIVEAASIGWTDNFLIPLVTAFLTWFLVFPTTLLLLP
jgi:dolichol kinase